MKIAYTSCWKSKEKNMEKGRPVGRMSRMMSNKMRDLHCVSNLQNSWRCNCHVPSEKHRPQPVITVFNMELLPLCQPVLYPLNAVISVEMDIELQTQPPAGPTADLVIIKEQSIDAMETNLGLWVQLNNW